MREDLEYIFHNQSYHFQK